MWSQFGNAARIRAAFPRTAVFLNVATGFGFFLPEEFPEQFRDLLAAIDFIPDLLDVLCGYSLRMLFAAVAPSPYVIRTLPAAFSIFAGHGVPLLGDLTSPDRSD